MNPELREAIGKVLYEASVPLMDDDEPTWDELSDEAKETWMARAEKVIEAFIGPLLPNIIPVVNALVAINPTFEKATKDLIRAATGKEWTNE